MVSGLVTFAARCRANTAMTVRLPFRQFLTTIPLGCCHGALAHSPRQR